MSCLPPLEVSHGSQASTSLTYVFGSTVYYHCDDAYVFSSGNVDETVECIYVAETDDVRWELLPDGCDGKYTKVKLNHVQSLHV